MVRPALYLAIALVGVGIAGCGKPSRPAAESKQVIRPVTLLIEQEITGPVLGSSIKRPFGVAVDFRGIIFVCDAGNNRIVKFTSDFAPQDQTPGYGSSEGHLDQPTFITIDNGLNVFVSDVGNRRISRFDSRLYYVDEINLVDQDDPLKFGVPSGLALTAYGELWMADRERERIAIFNNVGTFQKFIGGFGYSGGQLSLPEKIVTNRTADKFFVCDAGNRRLVVYDSYGNYDRKIVNPDFNYPIAASMDKSDNLWVLDGDGRIFYVTRGGEELFQSASRIPGSNIALQNPSDIAVLPDNRLLISDTGNNRLLVCKVIYEE